MISENKEIVSAVKLCRFNYDVGNVEGKGPL